MLGLKQARPDHYNDSLCRAWKRGEATPRVALHQFRLAVSVLGCLFKNLTSGYLITSTGNAKGYSLDMAQMSPAGYQEIRHANLMDTPRRVAGSALVWSQPAFVTRMI